MVGVFLGDNKPRTPAEDGSNASSAMGDLPIWDLTDLYPSIDSPAVEDDLKASLDESIAFETAHKGHISTILSEAGGPEKLAGIIAAYELLEERLGRLMSYAGLIYAGNTTDPDGAKFYGDVQERLTTASAHLLFFTLELNRIDDVAIDAALKNETLAHYGPWLTDIRLDKPYQLEDRVEQLFHEKSVTGVGAWNRLFDETIADLKFKLGDKSVAIESALNDLQDRDPARRKQAALALGDGFRGHLRTFTLITNTLAKDKEISDRWRGFDDVAASRHLANRVEPHVVEALEAAVRDAYPRLSHRYYAMKARWLGMDKLMHWDRNAPLPLADDRIIGWQEARQTVLDAYHQFSPEMADIARQFFDKSWIDAPVRPGKSPGAFSHPTVPGAHPYVLLNYLGKSRDVMTLAHELGHGVHQVLAGPNGALMAPTPLTLAETASVFGEMLTFRRLLKSATTPQQRKVLLAAKVEDMINTVVRQIAFYTFERRVHTERRNGELTADRLGEIWLDVQYESLGEAVEIGPGYDVFWTYIPHFIHAPFYVYAYAFGDCMVNSLYAVYEGEGSGFQDRYFDMLKAGGTKHHSQLLAPFGLDAGDPAFWQMGLSMIDGMIDELETLDTD